MAPAPKFRRRKAARPAEIVEAALTVFVEKGFAGARLDDIAASAGVSKGALYLYFATKEDLFRAVVGRAITPNLAAARSLAANHPGPFAELARGVAGALVRLMTTTPVGAVAKMVIGEARNFPELARIWHDDVVSQALAVLSEAIRAAQARGELNSGDPRAYALQFAAPLLVTAIWRETFEPVGAPPFDINALAAQHIETFLHGACPTGAPT